MAQLQSDLQKDIDKQVYLLKKVTKERDDARIESNESQQSARGMFNEQKRLESQMDRMKDEVGRSNKAVDKIRDEVVRLRSKVNELQHEKSDLRKQHESHIADEESAARERDTVLADLRSLLDRRNQQLNDMERSRDTIEEDRARIQLHSNEVTVTIVSLRRELDEARAGALTARASEEATRLQITRMMDEQLAQNQTIDPLRRQVESSNTSAQQAQALLREQ
jgi:chromosome segregation ATPase